MMHLSATFFGKNVFGWVCFQLLVLFMLLFRIFFVSLRDGKDWPELSLRAMYPALRVPPGGNQVDGLPPVAIPGFHVEI